MLNTSRLPGQAGNLMILQPSCKKNGSTKRSANHGGEGKENKGSSGASSVTQQALEANKMARKLLLSKMKWV